MTNPEPNNNDMSYKPSYQNYKDSRRRKNVYAPLILGVLAVLLIGVGVTLIFLFFSGAGGNLAWFSTKTPTFTNSPPPPPPTEIPSITPIPSETPIPSITPTPTPSEPFFYEVQSGDTIDSLAIKFNVDAHVIMAYNGLTFDSILYVGDQLLIPPPGAEMPTPTPYTGARGVVIDYFVLPGDSLKIIAEKFLTTVEAIIEANDDLEPPEYKIYPGQIIKVPIWLITPTFGPSPTVEGAPTNTMWSPPTQTPSETP